MCCFWKIINFMALKTPLFITPYVTCNKKGLDIVSGIVNFTYMCKSV